MTNYDRIAQAYNDKAVVSICRKLRPHDWEDLRSDVAEKLLMMPDTQLSTIRNMTQFMSMCCRNAGLDIHRSSLRNRLVNLDTDVQESEDGYSRLNAKIQADMDSPKRFYHARIFVYTMQEQNVLAFSKKIGIPYREVRRVIKEYTEYIRSWLNE